VLGRNLGLGSGYPEAFVVFFSPLPENSEIVPQLGHDRYIPNSFQFLTIHNHPTMQRNSLDIETVVKYTKKKSQTG
jgi:hypothetical protein